MSRPFVARDGRIEVRLAPAERDVLRALPVLLSGASTDEGDPDWARLRSVGHLDDPEMAVRFRELTAGLLEEARAGDRDRLAAALDSTSLDPADADAWLRVIGEARLLLAARLGIEEDGWEAEAGKAEPVELSVLRLLGFFQETLVEALSESL